MPASNESSDSILFQASGDLEYSPSPHTQLYVLEDIDYNFKLTPELPFWNFGLRFCNENEVDFSRKSFDFPGSGTLFLSGGEIVRSQNHRNPNMLRLSHSNLDFSTPLIQGFYEYKEKSTVLLSISYQKNTSILRIKVKTNEDFSLEFTIKPFKYFKIFAWGEWEPVQLRCDMSWSKSVRSRNNPEAESTVNNHWLLKIRALTWDIRQFKEGQATWFNTYNLDETRREEYSLLKKAKKGDLVLAYAYENYNAIVCIMEITEGVHSDQGKGEVVSMVIKEMKDPPIRLKGFELIISGSINLRRLDGPRWFELSEDQYKLIILSATDSASFQSQYHSYDAEGNHAATSDKLDFIWDIESFATIISMQNVKPPLAIGLFGNWGSGKTFFMEKLRTAINEKKGTSGKYIRSVVQVWFNSWHYADTNLWASLITEIFEELERFAKQKGKFTELERLSQTLRISNLNKIEEEKRLKELEDKQKDLQYEQQKNRSLLSDLSGIHLLKFILTDPEVRKDLEKLENENIDSILTDAGKINFYMQEVKNHKNKVTQFVQSVKELKGKWWVVVIFAVFIFLIVWLVFNIPAIRNWWQRSTFEVAGIISVVATFIGTVWKIYQPIKRRFDEAYKRLKSLKNTMANRPDRLSSEINENERQLKAVTQNIEILNKQLHQTQQEMEDLQTGRSLMNFIEERSQDERYTKQLGVISYIRRDFQRLDELLRLQFTVGEEMQKKLNPENIQLQIDRIVLYIDDLDRCNETIVVKVLEAVHLLLAFPLFVVVVGVDPRWLNESLDKKFPFFKKGKNGKKDYQLVNSYDYLEKIFQIPFSLRPITRNGREELLSYLIEKELEFPGESDMPSKSASTSNEIISDNNELDLSTDEDQNETEYEESLDQKPEPKEKETDTIVEQIQLNQQFTISELSYMKEVSGIFGHSPRTIKRFINIYRILKAHRNFKNNHDDRPTLLVLAIIVGQPEYAQEFVQVVNSSTEPDLVSMLKSSEKLTNLYNCLKQQLYTTSWETFLAADLKSNLELTSRFSFRTLAVGDL